jgi:outer membrane protein insertion porin family
MRIVNLPTIVILTLAAVAGGALAARAATEVELRDADTPKAIDLTHIRRHSQEPVGAGSPTADRGADRLNKPAPTPQKSRLLRIVPDLDFREIAVDLPKSEENAVAVEVRSPSAKPSHTKDFAFLLKTPIDLKSCTILKNGQDARSTKDEFDCGTGILPVHNRLIENGTTSQIDPIAVGVKNGQDARSTKDEFAGGTGILPVDSTKDEFAGGTGILPVHQGLIEITQAPDAGGVYVADVKIRFVNSRGEAVDKKGNPIEGRISEDFIRGELKLKAGDNYSQDVVRSDLQQLQQLGLFDKVTVSTEEVGTDINVIYNVQERSARSFGVNASLDDDIGVAIPLSYTDRTFGTNPQRLLVEVQPSLRDVEYNVQFVSPYVAAEDRLGYSVRTFRDRKTSDIFNNDIDLPNDNRVREIRMGGNLAFTRPLGDWRGTLGLNYTNISTRDRNLNIARRDELGNPLTFSGSGVDELYTVSVGATLDRRDNPFNPTNGSILSLSTEQSIPLGQGNIVSNKLLANYIQYVPVTLFGISESTELPEMLAFNLQAGTVIGDLPPTEAFRLGGRNSVRGYDSGDVGSGRSYFLASGEYRFPFGRDVGGVIFVDFASDLGTGDSVLGKPASVRDKPGTGAGAGVGVRVRSPFGLIRLDVGVSDGGEIKFVLGTKQRF